METTKQTENPIKAAVMPLIEDAKRAARNNAGSLVAKVANELQKAGNDLEVCAPYPKSYGYSAVSRSEYQRELAKYQLYRQVTKRRKPSRSFNEPNFADMDAELTARFIKQCEDDAAAQYLDFVEKLILKVGHVSAAKLEGNHVWSFSILTVNKPDGSTEQWKTQMIINVSKLGKLFNQWPTRKLGRRKETGRIMSVTEWERERQNGGGF